MLLVPSGLLVLHSSASKMSKHICVLISLLFTGCEITTTTTAQTTASAPADCLASAQDTGATYRGTQNITETGIVCQAWNEQSPHSHASFTPATHPNAGLTMNFCRNPDGASKPWCFTRNNNIRKQTCKIPICNQQKTCANTPCRRAADVCRDTPNGPKCERDCLIYTKGRGWNYVGNISVTQTGKNCQPWWKQTPHSHQMKPKNYPYASLTKNYCRNPNNKSRAYCFTTDKSVKWEFCKIPICPKVNLTTLPVAATTPTPTVSNQTHNLVVCERKTGVASCPSGQVIQVIKALYGRQDATTCSFSLITNCYAAGSFDTIKTKCDGSNSCNLTAVNSVFGDPCPLIPKHIYVDYRCAVKGQAQLSYKTLRCWKDTSNRAIPTLEGDPSLDGAYQTRQNAVEKCAALAYKKRYPIFALQNGGWCASSATANATYQKYGKSAACKANGKGGPWGNQVYLLDLSALCTKRADSESSSQFNFTCPSGCETTIYKLWGTVVYTSGSYVCAAAIHAGIISSSGGQVSVYKSLGRSAYFGSTQNGLTSKSYGQWQSSFQFTDPNFAQYINGTYTVDQGENSVNPTKMITVPFDTCFSVPPINIVTTIVVSGSYQFNVKITGTYVWGFTANVTRIDTTSGHPSAITMKWFLEPITCTKRADSESNPQFSVACPPGCAATSNRLWGTDVYTSDSYICAAAIHAGVIANSGGQASVYKTPGNSSYTGSTRNGLTSKKYGRWQSSFQFTSPNSTSITVTAKPLPTAALATTPSSSTPTSAAVTPATSQTINAVSLSKPLQGYTIFNQSSETLRPSGKVTIRFPTPLSSVPASIDVNLTYSGSYKYMINITSKYAWGFTINISRIDSMSGFSTNILIHWTAHPEPLQGYTIFNQSSETLRPSGKVTIRFPTPLSSVPASIDVNLTYSGSYKYMINVTSKYAWGFIVNISRIDSMSGFSSQLKLFWTAHPVQPSSNSTYSAVVPPTIDAVSLSKPLQGYTIFNQSSETLRPSGKVTIRFPTPLSSVPASIDVNLTYSGNYKYTINVTSKYAWGFTINISRIDSISGFSPNISIHWTAHPEPLQGYTIFNQSSETLRPSGKVIVRFPTPLSSVPASIDVNLTYSGSYKYMINVTSKYAWGFIVNISRIDSMSGFSSQLKLFWTAHPGLHQPTTTKIVVPLTTSSTTGAVPIAKPPQGATKFNQSSETLRPTGEVTIRFPTPLSSVPVFIDVNLTYNGNYSYITNVTGKYIWGFTVNISRIDSVSGFAKEIWIHWIAYLANQACSGMAASKTCAKAYKHAETTFLSSFKTSSKTARRSSLTLTELTRVRLTKQRIEALATTLTSAVTVIVTNTIQVEVPVLSNILLVASNMIQAMKPNSSYAPITINSTKKKELVDGVNVFAKKIQLTALLIQNNTQTMDHPHVMLKVVRPIRNFSYSDLIYKTTSYMNQNTNYKATTVVVKRKILNKIFPVQRLTKRAVVNSNTTPTIAPGVVEFLLYRDSVLFPGSNTPVEVITVQSSLPVPAKLPFAIVLQYPNPCATYQKPNNRSLKICIASPTCASWNSNKTSWSATSCWLAGVYSTKIECMCDSFGTFGMLAWKHIDLKNFDLPAESEFSCALTAFLLIITFLLYLFIRSLRRRKPVLPTMCTILCLALTNIIFLGGVEQICHRGPCNLITFLWHWMILSTFAWMFITAGNFKHCADGKDDARSRRRIIPEVLLGFGLTFLIVLINSLSAVFTADKPGQQWAHVFESEYRERHACFPREFSLFIGLLLPAGIFLLLTIILLIMTRIALKAKKDSEEDNRPLMKDVDHIWLIWVFLTILTTLAWIFVPFMVNADNTSSKSTFSWFFAIINIIEGIVVLYLACLHRKIDREDIRRCCCCETTEAEVFALTAPHKSLKAEEGDDEHHTEVIENKDENMPSHTTNA